MTTEERLKILVKEIAWLKEWKDQVQGYTNIDDHEEELLNDLELNEE